VRLVQLGIVGILNQARRVRSRDVVVECGGCCGGGSSSGCRSRFGFAGRGG
jgi:hypothetical protein